MAEMAIDAPAEAQRLRRVSDSIGRQASAPPPRPPGDDGFSGPRTWLQRP
jgi:hypothetical protein